MGREIEYLNTDLSLSSTEDLRPLAGGLEGRGGCVLYVGCHDEVWAARCEAGGELCVRGAGRDYTPAGHIAWLLDCVESLPSDLAAVWRRCTARVFDIGYRCGSRPFGFQQALDEPLLRRMHEHGASLRITIYPTEAPAPESIGAVWRRYPKRRRANRPLRPSGNAK